MVSAKQKLTVANMALPLAEFSLVQNATRSLFHAKNYTTFFGELLG